MKPRLNLQIQDTIVKTKVIDEGGIHPVWKQKMSKEHQLYLFNLDSAADQLDISITNTSMITNSLKEVGRCKIQIQDKKIFRNAKSIPNMVERFIIGISKDDKTKRLSKLKQQKNSDQKLKL